jgi:hypothetical protein
VTRCGPNPLREDMQDPLGVFAPHGRTLRAGAATGPLAGATFAVKDVFDLEGTITGRGDAPTLWALLDASAPQNGSNSFFERRVMRRKANSSG